MANDTALGKILEIDQKTIDSINNVSTNITAIAKASEDAAKAFNSAFESMHISADTLNKDLVAIKTQLDGMGIDLTKIQAPFDEVSKKSEDAAKIVTDAIRSIAEFDVSGSSIAQLGKQISKIQSALTKGKGVTDPVQEQELVNYLDQLKKVRKEQFTSEEEKTKKQEQEQAKREALDERETQRILAEIEQRRKAYLTLLETFQRLRVEGYGKAPEGSPQKDYYNNINTQFTQAIHDLDEIEKKYGELAKLNKDAFDAKQLKVVVDYTNKEAAMQEKARKEADRKAQANERAAAAAEKARRAAEEESRKTFQGSLSYAKTTKTYDDRARAIKYLEAAMRSLDPAEDNYRTKLEQLASVHKKLINEQAEVEKAMGGTKKAMTGLAGVAAKLGPMLASVFSIRALTGFTKKLIEVRGEFELQNVALASILDNKERADQLFEQVTELAIKSPFTIRQLTSYTKQLAAYQVQYKDLFKVTKQLADVSAGLGVDMQRLILAYGQVRAANYLRATEVRQFTEAGINILGELAKYYSELEGTMISVADVQERVTKRMVEFSDVEEIFNRITSAGGLFYDMQAKQAETLRGMWMNLQDRIDIMFNEIGKSTDTYLKSAIRALTFLMDHYKEIIKVLKDVGIAYGLYRLSMLDVIKTYRQLFAAASGVGRVMLAHTLSVDVFRSLGSVLKKATVAMKGFLASAWPLIALTVAFEAISGVVKHYKELAEAQDEVTKRTNSHVAAIEKIEHAFNALKVETESAEDALKNYRSRYAELSKLFDKMQDSGLATLFTKDAEGVTIPIRIQEVTKENIDKVFEVSSEMARKAEEYGAVLGSIMAESLNAVQGRLLGVSFLGDNLATDAEQLERVYGKMNARMKATLQDVTDAILANADAYSEAAQPYLDILREGKKEGQTELEYLKESIKAAKALSNSYIIGEERAKKAVNLYNKFYTNVNRKEKEVEREINKVMDSLENEYGGLDKLAANPIAFKAAIDTEIARQEVSEMVKDLEKRTIYMRYNLVQVNQDTSDRGLNELSERIDELQDKAGVEIIPETELKKIKNYTDAQEALQKVYDDNNKKIKQTSTSTSELIGEYGTAAAETKKYSDAAATATSIATALGLTLSDKKTAKTASDIAKERVELLKQIRKEYEENLKVMGKAQADAFTKEQFAENAVFQQLQQMGVIDASLNVDANGLITSLERLAERSTGAARKLIESVIADLNNEQVKIDIRANLENVKKEVNDLFERLELTKQVDALGLGKELTEELFDFETVDLSELKRQLDRIKEEYSKNNHGIGEEAEKYFAEVEKKITDQRTKELRERLKEYAKYLKLEAGAVAAAKLEEAKKVREIQEMEAAEIVSPKQADNMRTSLKKETQEKIDQAIWDDFKNTEIYIHLFEDLEYASVEALDTMEERLLALGDSLKGLSPHQLREIQTQINKIQEQKIERSPIQSLIEQLEEVKKLKESGLTEDVLTMTIKNADDRTTVAKNEISELEEILGLRMRNMDAEADIAASTSSCLQWLYMSNDELRAEIMSRKGIVDEAQKESEIAEGQLMQYRLLRAAVTGSASAVREFIGKMTDAFSETVGLIEDITGESYDLLDVFGGVADTVGEVIVSVTELAVAVEILGYAIDSALGIVGIILIVVKAIASVIRSIVQADQKRFEEQMDEAQKKVDRLRETYDKLEKAIEECYSIGNLRKYNREAQETLKATIAQEEAMIHMYKARKNGSNKYKQEIEELEKGIEEANEDLKELAENTIETLGGFGSQANLKSAAEEFVEAWKAAFNETGNGLSGLQDKMDEFVDNAVKHQLLLRLSERYITPILEEFDRMFDKASPEGELMTKEELEAWKRLYEQYAEAFDDKAKAYLDALGVTSGPQTGSLSTLTEEYGQMSEATANVLAAINESIRFFEADSNLVLHNIELILTAPGENPFYLLMKQQAQYTRDIRDMIRKTFTTIGTDSVLKVQMI